MARNGKSSKVKLIFQQKPPSDCLKCSHHSIVKFGLIQCDAKIPGFGTQVIPQLNCLDRKITCIYFNQIIT